jgi:hypothetical protein
VDQVARTIQEPVFGIGEIARDRNESAGRSCSNACSTSMGFGALAADPPSDSLRPSKIPQSRARSSNAWASLPAHRRSSPPCSTTEDPRPKKPPANSTRPRRTKSRRTTQEQRKRQEPELVLLDPQLVPHGSLAPAAPADPAAGSTSRLATRRRRLVPPRHVEIVPAKAGPAP